MKRFTMALFLLVFGAGMWGCGKEDLGKKEDGGDSIMAQVTSPEEEEPDSAKAEGGEDRQGQVPAGSEERESPEGESREDQPSSAQA